MPLNISHVNTSEIDIRYESLGVTMTSVGNAAIANFGGTQADVYSPDLKHLYHVDLEEVKRLASLTSQGEILFVVDHNAQGIHVSLNDGRFYSHLIKVSWQPSYAHILGDTLYVPHITSRKLYAITLDAAYKKVGTNLIISSPVYELRQVYVDSERIAVNMDWELTVFNNDGAYKRQWKYKVRDPKGVTKDNHGRYLVAASGEKAIELISPEGHFIQNVVQGLPGYPIGIALTGNTIYVAVATPNKLYKFTVS
jgi:sugar lactone lactonase YvrE